jgi:hypothetical protein
MLASMMTRRAARTIAEANLVNSGIIQERVEEGEPLTEHGPSELGNKSKRSNGPRVKRPEDTEEGLERKRDERCRDLDKEGRVWEK